MTSIIGEAAVRIRPETSAFAKDVKLGVGSALKSVALAASGLFAAAGLGKIFKDSFAEAQEARKVTAQVNAVIKSTGGIAKVTAKETDKLAESLSGISGVDDEIIQRGEALLLTFTSIRNEAGKGNDVFNQATAAALDLSAALGQDMQSSVIQLGKALNDPIRGVTALRRVGVSFTEAQQKQIKALVGSNNLLGAQKLILGELKKEFGGAAAALATPWDKMKVALKNVEEAIGTALLPTLDRFSKFVASTVVPFITDKLIPALKDVFGAVGQIVSVVGPVAVAAVKTFFSAFNGPEAQGAKENTKGVADATITLNDILTAFIEDVVPGILDAAASLGDVFRTDIIPNVKLTIDIFKTFGLAVFGAGVQAEHVVRDVIGAFEAFGRFLDGFVERFRLVFQGIGDFLHGFFDIIRNLTTGAIAVLGGLMRFIAGLFTGNIKAALHGLAGVFSGLGRIIFGSIGGITRAMIGVVEAVVGVFTGIIGKFFHVGSEVASGFFHGIIHTIGRLASHLPGFLKRLIPDNIRDFFDIHSPSRVMFKLGMQVGEGFNLGVLESFRQASIDGALRRLTSPFDLGTGVSTFDAAVTPRVQVVQHITTAQTDPRVLANEILYRAERESQR